MQLPLSLTLSQRTVLITVDTARAVLGVDADTIRTRIQTGEIRWAFDISSHASHASHLAEPRLLALELVHPARAQAMTLPDIIDHIIGTTRESLTRVETARTLLCSRPHIKALVDTAHLAPDATRPATHILRASLATLLRLRQIV